MQTGALARLQSQQSGDRWLCRITSLLALSPYILDVLLFWGPLVQCNCCPRCWTCVELLSRHYTCAERNSLAVHSFLTQREKVAVGDKVC